MSNDKKIDVNEPFINTQHTNNTNNFNAYHSHSHVHNHDQEIPINNQNYNENNHIILDPQMIIDGYPCLDRNTALVILLLNVFLCGIGTITMGCTVGGQRGNSWVCIGIIQFLLWITLIGWAWSIFTGIMVLKYSRTN